MFRSYRFVLFAVSLLGLASCSKEFEPLGEYVPEPVCDRTGECVISVELDAPTVEAIETGRLDAEDFFARVGARCVERLFPDAGYWEPRHRRAGLHKWYSVTLDSSQPTKAVGEISDIPGVLYAGMQPEAVMSAIPFNDKLSYLQWGLFNDGNLHTLDGSIRRGAFKAGADINIVPVWEDERFNAGTGDVIVAVIDDGIYNHPDLDGVLIPAGEHGSRNFIMKNTDDPYVIEPGYHATCVASVIAGINNNRIWFSGIAGGRDGSGGVRVLNCQIIASDSEDKGKTYSSDNIGRALVWAADNGALICNNSWGYNYEEGMVPEKTPREIAAAIDYFIEFAGTDIDGNQNGRMKGGLVIFSAGNENSDASQPAMYDNVLAVGAFGPNGKRATYSNYGPWVDICAPGGDKDAFILYGEDASFAMIPGLDTDASTLRLIQGTSIAAPFVSGVAALLVSNFGGEGFTPDMLRTMLIKGAGDPVISGIFDGRKNIGPTLDACGAFNVARGEPVQPSDVSVSAFGNAIDFAWNVSGKDGFACPGYRLYASRDENITDEDPYEDFVTLGTDIGKRVSHLFRHLEFDSDYFCAVCGISLDRNSKSALSPAVRVHTGPNHAPVSVSPVPDVLLGENESFVLIKDEHFRDEDDEILEVVIGRDNANSLDISEDSGSITFSAKKPGMTNIHMSVSDSSPETLVFDFRILVKAPASLPYELFPVPVNDYLYVRNGSEVPESLSLRVFNYAGKEVFCTSAEASVFDPARVDMRDFAPGVYEIKVSGDAGDFSKNIVKK